MKEISEIKAMRIISEPGDATRYDYIAIQTGPDDVSFMPYGNTFYYPQMLNKWQVKEMNPDDVSNEPGLKILAEEEGCNPYTLAECIRTLREILGE